MFILEKLPNSLQMPSKHTYTLPSTTINYNLWITSSQFFHKTFNCQNVSRWTGTVLRWCLVVMLCFGKTSQFFLLDRSVWRRPPWISTPDIDLALRACTGITSGTHSSVTSSSSETRNLSVRQLWIIRYTLISRSCTREGNSPIKRS